MEAQAQSFQSIFTRSSLFVIPYFQRQYVWKKENWERLWNDLSNLVDNPHIYFLGSLIAKKGNADFTLIDGQQRSTTLFLLLKALYLRSGSNDLFVMSYFQYGDINDGPLLIHNKHDRPIFNEIMNMGNFADPLYSSGNVLDAWNYFKEVVGNISVVQAKNMYRIIERYVRFVYITLSEEDDEQQIFDTINSLGVDLTTGELLKNYFFDKSNESVYSNLWAPVFERANSDYWSDSLTKGRIKESNIEQFFYALLQIVMSEPTYNISSETKKGYRLKDQVFASYKHLFRTQKIEQNKDPFIAMTVDYGKLYQSTFSKKVLDQTIKPAPDVKRLSLIMYARKMMSVIPYILYVLHEQSDTNEQQRIFGYIEAYIVRRIICGSSSGNYADLFSENLIGQHVCTYQALKDYIDAKSADASLAMPTDQDIHTCIQTQKLSDSASLLLYMLESMSQGATTTIGGLNSYMAEQLLPPKSTSSWPLLASETEADRKIKAQTLGNFVLISADNKLKSRQRVDWATESTALKPLCKDFDATLHPVAQSQWTPAEVDTQNQLLADLICQYWTKDGVAATLAPTASTQAASVVAATVIADDDITIDEVKPFLDFTEEDYELTDYVYHTFDKTDFKTFVQNGIDAGGDVLTIASSLNQQYEQNKGCCAVSRNELVTAIGQNALTELDTAHPLWYIGKCSMGWVVSYDRNHVLRRPSSVALKSVLDEAEAYQPESIDGLWDLLKKDNQIKGILTDIKEQEVLKLKDSTYHDAVECLIRFIDELDEVSFQTDPKKAKSFDQLREGFYYVLDARTQSRYFQRHPYLVRMIFDIINYIEDYYSDNQNINLVFKTTKKVAKARITYLDTGAAPQELSILEAIRVLAAKYTQDFKGMTIDGITKFLVNGPMDPGARYKQLSNGWYVFNIDSRKASGFLIMMARRIPGKVLVEIL